VKQKTSKVKNWLTPKQSRFAAAYAKSHSMKEAALVAGYSPKNPSQSANQALAAIKEKAPEVMAAMGLTLGSVIENHLVPLMHAREMKFAQYKGKFTDYVEVEALGIRLGATVKALELLNAFPSRDQALAAQVGVDVIVMDMPRPKHPPIDVQPANGNTPKKELQAEKPDPRPKD
jgi:hypothetical protein